MARNKLGSHTFRPEIPVYIGNWASVAGKKEAEGPLGHGFDIKSMDTRFGEKTWEQAEKRMQQLALDRLLEKAQLKPRELDLVFSGDLLNQCIGSSFSLRNTGIPHLGLYGACSTMAQSLLLAAMTVGGGYADRVVAMTSSHFAGSERQYRFPLGYGGQRTPTAQWTVTGSGAALVTSQPGSISIESATIGTVSDLGITDANNMGAAMAPAAVDTLTRYFSCSGTVPEDFDVILTGDLGAIGHDITMELLYSSGFNIRSVYNDCGLMIYSAKEQDVHAGGSGCGCSGTVICGPVMKRLRQGIYKNVLFIGTGALMSPGSVQQGMPIAGIAHLVRISSELPGTLVSGEERGGSNG